MLRGGARLGPGCRRGRYEQQGGSVWRLADYTQLVVALRCTRTGWVEPGPPLACPQGHTLRGPYRVLVGTQQCATCSAQGLGAHRSFTCRTCSETVYDPPPGPNCTFVALDGRAAPPRAGANQAGGEWGGSAQIATQAST